MSKASGSIDLKSLKVAGEGASKYITDITNNGIKVASATASNLNYITIDATGMEIFKTNSASTSSAISVAKFGETIRVGKDGESHLELDFHSMSFKEPPIEYSGGIYFSVADLKDETGKLTYTDQVLKVAEDNLKIRKFDPSVDRNYSLVIKKNGTVLPSSSYTIIDNDTAVNLGNTTVEESDVITASYTTTDYRTKFFTFGYRKSNQATGPMSIAMGVEVVADGESCGAFGEESMAHGKASFAFGNGCSAKGHGSFAEGAGTTASEMYSHAEGSHTTASGGASHAEGTSTTASGSNSHAEGIYTVASGTISHAEGNGVTTTRIAFCSHSEGEGTVAGSPYQHVQGKYNVEDSNIVYADIVGNGSSDSARANIEATTWAGDKRMKGSVYVTCNDDSTGGKKLVTASTQSDSGTINDIPSSTTFTNLDTVSLPDPGVYMLIGLARFESNTNGRRALTWGTTATGYLDHSLVLVAPVNGAMTRMQSTAIVTVTTAPFNIYLNCYHTAGTGNQLNVDYYWRYLKLA